MFLLIQNSVAGLFSDFTVILGALFQFKLKIITGLVVITSRHSPYYDRRFGDNVWTYYFNPINISHDGDFTPSFTIYHDIHRCFLADLNNDKWEANKLINEYIIVKPHILEEVNMFIHTHFKGSVIGIHYRGTDKSSEAKRVSYNTMFTVLDNFLQNHTGYLLFVATDEELFINQMNDKYPQKVIYQDIKRSNNGLPIHYANRDPYLSGKQALIDCILLSRTKILFKTASNLNRVSSYFNPSLQVISIQE